jgi:hypothetical protein
MFGRLIQFVTMLSLAGFCAGALANSDATQKVNTAQSETPHKDPQHKADPIVQPPPEGKLPRALVALTAASPYALLVDKTTRTLTVWKWNNDKPTLVASYPTDIGRNNGDKVAEGDHRTPEGVYFFQSIKNK